MKLYRFCKGLEFGSLAYKSCAFEMNAAPNNKLINLLPIFAMKCIFINLVIYLVWLIHIFFCKLFTIFYFVVMLYCFQS
jgi:hypothetical protein